MVRMSQSFGQVYLARWQDVLKKTLNDAENGNPLDAPAVSSVLFELEQLEATWPQTPAVSRSARHLVGLEVLSIPCEHALAALRFVRSVFQRLLPEKAQISI